MSPDDGSRTAMMPEGLIVGSAPTFGLSREAHASRRQRRRLGLSALAAALIVVVIILFHGADATKPLDLTTTTVTPPNASVPAATVDPNVLVGLSTQRASDILSKAGFVVAIDPVEAAGVPAGTVTGVQPSGQVPSGATVTLKVSNGAVTSTTTTVAETTDRPKKKGHGKPNG